MNWYRNLADHSLLDLSTDVYLRIICVLPLNCTIVFRYSVVGSNQQCSFIHVKVLPCFCYCYALGKGGGGIFALLILFLSKSVRFQTNEARSKGDFSKTCFSRRGYSLSHNLSYREESRTFSNPLREKLLENKQMILPFLKTKTFCYLTKHQRN